MNDNCPECKRPKAKSADDCANGYCSKWYSVRDKEAHEDCVDHANLINSSNQQTIVIDTAKIKSQVPYSHLDDKHSVKVFYEKFVAPYYRQPHRFYHTEEHLAFMLSLAHELKLELTVEQELALLFHDAVYRPGSTNNEEDSACILMYLAEQYKEDRVFTSFISQVDLSIVCQIIRDTKEHTSTLKESIPALDLDLAILGAPAEVYQAYSHGIMKEHVGVVTLGTYVQRRLNWLRNMINSRLVEGTLFQLEDFNLRYDQQAFTNMRAEIRMLQVLEKANLK